MSGPSRERLLPALLLLAFSWIPAAQAAAPAGITREEYRSRREALARLLRKEIPPGSSAVLMLDSAPEPDNLAFRQESNLYYLMSRAILVQ